MKNFLAENVMEIYSCLSRTISNEGLTIPKGLTMTDYGDYIIRITRFTPTYDDKQLSH